MRPLLSYEDFKRLPPEHQLVLLGTEGVRLAHAWGPGEDVELYYLHGFFCKLYYDPQTNALRRTECFRTGPPPPAGGPTAAGG